MNYNTSLPKLIISEYGRNVQNLVDHIVKIDDDEERKAAAHRIIKLMGQLHPQYRNIEDFKQKLWDHLYKISDYKLVVDGPFERPSREELERRPDPVSYPQSRITFRHYGKNVEHMIESCLAIDDEKKKQAYAKVIASYMKMVHQNWNGENVPNEVILNDLQIMSNGKLKLPEDTDVDYLAKNNRPRSNHSNSKSKYSKSNYKKRKKGGYSKNSNNNSRGRRNHRR